MSDSPNPSAPCPRQWRCLVCGYVHTGDAPPDCCAICGAASADFEPIAAAPAAAAHNAPAASRWRCDTCGYLHDGDAPPDACPVCGAPAACFQPAPATPPAEPAAALRVVIVGAGIAGVAAAETLRARSAGSRITLVSTEAELPYYRLNLTRYLAGEIARDTLPLHPQAWYDQQDVRLLRGVAVDHLDPAAREVILADGRRLPYDRLILSAGSHPYVPPLPGIRLDGVFNLRTAADADRLLACAARGVRCICIGGGVLGIETAGALARHGADVLLLESHAHLMPRQLNRAAAAVLERHLGGLGVRVFKEARTASIEGDGAVTGVRLLDGRALPADLVVLATGVRPNTALARKAGLDVNTGIVVDSHLTTSRPEILAAGDVAEHNGLLYGTWAASQAQGTLAALNALGLRTAFGGLPRANTVKALGLDLTSIGRFQPEDGSDLLLEDAAPGAAYRAFLFRDNRLEGAILVGRADLAAPAKRAIEARRDFSLALRRAPDCESVARLLLAGD